MRALVLILTTLFSLCVWAGRPVTAPGKAPVASKNLCDGNIEGGDPSPWPWGLETTFPWKVIRGQWATDSCDRMFTFRPVTGKATRGSEPLKATQIIEITDHDSNGCKIATGIGYEANKVVRATMAKIGTREIYDLTLRAFGSGANGYRSGAVVLTVSPHGEWLKRKTFEMQKIGEHTNLFCYDKP